MQAPNLSTLVTVLCFFTTCPIFAADTVQAEKPDIEWISVSVHVADELGNSIANAKVTPFGFRTKIERGSHYGWNPRAHGKQEESTTDEKGNATLRVPKFVYEKLEIGEVTWVVDHYDFVVYNADHLVDESPAEIVLKSGYRIAATAVGADTGERISDNLYAVLAGSSFSYDWKSKSGVLVSRAFDVERSNLRLAYLPTEKPAQFSDLIVVNRPGEDARVFLKKVEMKRGTRVTGSLDEAVPRPVEYGEIVAQVSETKDPENANYRNVWTWNDKVPIAADGSFVFESLPTGGIVQLIARCDGWVSKDPTQDEVNRVVPWKEQISASFSGIPQVFRLDQPQITCSIKMEQAASCKFVVLDAAEKPLADATVHLWPNHYWLKGGSTIFGFGYRSVEILEGKSPRDLRSEIRDFSGKTDGQGIVTVANLPSGPNIGYSVTHDKFDMPIAAGRRSGRVFLESGKTENIQVNMQLKGKDALGE